MKANPRKSPMRYSLGNTHNKSSCNIATFCLKKKHRISGLSCKILRSLIIDFQNISDKVGNFTQIFSSQNMQLA